MGLNLNLVFSSLWSRRFIFESRWKPGFWQLWALYFQVYDREKTKGFHKFHFADVFLQAILFNKVSLLHVQMSWVSTSRHFIEFIIGNWAMGFSQETRSCGACSLICYNSLILLVHVISHYTNKYGFTPPMLIWQCSKSIWLIPNQATPLCSYLSPTFFGFFLLSVTDMVLMNASAVKKMNELWRMSHC